MDFEFFRAETPPPSYSAATGGEKRVTVNDLDICFVNLTSITLLHVNINIRINFTYIKDIMLFTEYDHCCHTVVKQLWSFKIKTISYTNGNLIYIPRWFSPSSGSR